MGCYNLRCLANSHVYRATPDGLYYWNDTGTGNDVSFFGPDDRYTRRLERPEQPLGQVAGPLSRQDAPLLPIRAAGPARLQAAHRRLRLGEQRLRRPGLIGPLTEPPRLKSVGCLAKNALSHRTIHVGG